MTNSGWSAVRKEARTLFIVGAAVAALGLLGEGLVAWPLILMGILLVIALGRRGRADMPLSERPQEPSLDELVATGRAEVLTLRKALITLAWITVFGLLLLGLAGLALQALLSLLMPDYF